MLFGMTSGEISLVAFIFLLVYGAGFLPKVGDWLGRLLGGRARQPSGGTGGGDAEE